MRHSFKSLSEVAEKKGYRLDQTAPDAFHLMSFANPVIWSTGAKGYRAVINRKTGLPTFHSLQEVHLFLKLQPSLQT